MSQILSPNKYTGRRAPIRLIIIHTTETGEDGSVAEAVGRAFANPARQASSQVVIDTDSECRCVADEDTAWCAPGANADGLHEELAGRAGQTTSQWTDVDSKKILERGAQRTASWCRQYGIPARKLTDAQLADGKTRGIDGHDAVSRVFKRSDHWDPGPAFPWASFLARVQYLVGGASRPPQTKPTKPPATRIRLAVDGIFGLRSKARLQQWAGATVDSILGPLTWKKVQAKVGGLKVDGVPGPITWARIQRLVGARADGDPGPLTYRALQTYLNNH